MSDGFIWTDETGDGVGDTGLGDTDGDGFADTAAFDSDHDHIIDGYAYDTDRDGFFETGLVDADRDGAFETSGVDVDRDNIVDVIDSPYAEPAAEDIVTGPEIQTTQPTVADTGQSPQENLIDLLPIAGPAEQVMIQDTIDTMNRMSEIWLQADSD